MFRRRHNESTLRVAVQAEKRTRTFVSFAARSAHSFKRGRCCCKDACWQSFCHDRERITVRIVDQCGRVANPEAVRRLWIDSFSDIEREL
jgi:hypothetical protein